MITRDDIDLYLTQFAEHRNEIDRKIESNWEMYVARIIKYTKEHNLILDNEDFIYDSDLQEDFQFYFGIDEEIIDELVYFLIDIGLKISKKEDVKYVIEKDMFNQQMMAINVHGDLLYVMQMDGQGHCAQIGYMSELDSELKVALDYDKIKKQAR